MPTGNLVQNPGAEDSQGVENETGVATPASWGTTSNFTAVRYGTTTFPSAAVSDSIAGGTNFFAGGPGNASSLAEQIVDVSGAAAEIDAGRVTVRLSAHLGGYLTDGDNAKVTAALEDEHADTTLATVQVGPVTPADRGDQTTLLPRSATGAVPAGTRRVRLTITATRLAGSYNDGYADNVALELAVADEPAPPSPGPPPPPPDGTPPDTTPADTTPPDTTITGGPANGASVGDTAPTYEFTSDEPGSRFECRAYDPLSPTQFNASRDWAPCTSPHATVEPLRDDRARTFEVRATDAAGNVDPTPATRQAVNHGANGSPPPPSRCRMVEVDRAYGGKKLLPGCRLAPISHGKVPCVNFETARATTCKFGRRTGPWLKSTKGPKFALVGDSLSRSGGKVGPYIVAARRTARTVPCRKPPEIKKSDTSGRLAEGQELARVCMVEDMFMPWNASGEPLYNVTTREVCSSYPHPDWIEPVSTTDDGVFCYVGPGAALNDPNGTERSWTRLYFPESERCHFIITGAGYEIPAAKRPATRSHPAPVRVDTKTPIVWRPVAPGLDLAN